MSCKIGSQCFIDSNGIDLENKIIPVVMSDESKVMRFSWDEGIYDLILEHTEDAVDLRRKDILPILLQHDTDMLPMGIFQNVRLEDGKLKADAKFDSEDEKAMEVFGKMSRGFMQTLSVGVTIHSKILQEETEEKNTYKATRWEITEASIVTVPAIPNAQVGLSNKEVNMGGTSAETIPSDNVKLVNSNQGEKMELNQENLDNQVALNKVLLANKETMSTRNETLSAQVQTLTAQLDTNKEEFAALKVENEAKLSEASTKLEDATALATATAAATAENVKANIATAFSTNVASVETLNAMNSASTQEEAGKIALAAKPTTVALNQDGELPKAVSIWDNVEFKRK